MQASTNGLSQTTSIGFLVMVANIWQHLRELAVYFQPESRYCAPSAGTGKWRPLKLECLNVAVLNTDEQRTLLQPKDYSHDMPQSDKSMLPSAKTWLSAVQQQFLKALNRTRKFDVSGSTVPMSISQKDVSYGIVQTGISKDPFRNNKKDTLTSTDEDFDISGHIEKRLLGNAKRGSEKNALRTSLDCHPPQKVFSENVSETCPLYVKGNTSAENQLVSISDKDMNSYLPYSSDNGQLLDETPPFETRSESTWEKYTSCRWMLAYVAGFMSCCVHCLRTCMSMAIVCIRDAHDCRSREVNSNITKMMLNATEDYIPKEAEGVVLSSYFYGYLVTPFIFSVILARLGVKHVMTFSMAASAVLTLVTPAAIRHSVALTVTVRTMLGIMAGGNEPSGTILWVFWAPQTEKAKLVTFTVNGSAVGTLVANLVSGFLCSIPLDEGWPFIFYTYGTVTALWVFLWQYAAFDRPETHPRISTKELLYIQQHRLHDSPKLEKEDAEQHYKAIDEETNGPPWKCILTSVPFLSVLTTHVAYIWIYNFLATYLPLYISHRLHFSTQLNGVVSSLPFLSRSLTSPVFAVAADSLHTRSLLSVSTNRKLFQTIGLVLPGAILCGVGYLSAEEGGMVVVLIVVAGGLQAACISAYRVNYLDLSPRYAGALTGIAQTFSNLTQILATMVISYIVQDGLQSSWITAFVLSGVVGFVGAAVFVVFGSGDRQPWG